MIPRGERRFLVTNKVALISLFVLILAGGVVRSSGSGMGCPDWPKCFDRYVPPVSAAQLPSGYREKYVAKRVQKNERFAKTLDVMGYGELASRIRSDDSILEPEHFNAAKTWTEYVNRLIGALTGCFLIGCLVFSFAYRKSRIRILVLSLLNLVLVGFQGWLGSIVVSTNLTAWLVTFHMLLAMVILAISIYTYYDAKRLRMLVSPAQRNLPVLRTVAAVALLLSLLQVITGTEVREQIDAISKAMHDLNRSEWVSRVGTGFSFHRDSSLVVAAMTFVLSLMTIRKFTVRSEQGRYAIVLAGIIMLQMAMGVCLAYMALPGFAQALHVTLGALLFAAQFYLLLLLSPGAVKRDHTVTA
jgi:cytochrome c oxidase assembly protein subunit 15